jgi:hypothetical protein
MSHRLENPPKTIGEYLDKLISETRAELYNATVKEKERQKHTTQLVSKEKKESLEEDASNDDQLMKDGDVKVDDIVEKLNAIRAGRSFKDESIAAELNKYFTGLDAAERVALFAYLKGIQEIVSGVGTGEAAAEPSDPSPAVKMKREPKTQAIHIKPNVIRKSSTAEPTKSVEDTSAPTPAPITPKTAKTSV